MRPLHEQLLAAVADERARLRSRRALLADGAKVAGGGALAALALGVAPAGLRVARAQEFADDLDVLNYALTLELLEAAFYRDGLAALGEDAFETDEDEEATPAGTPAAAAEDALSPSRARLEEIRDHELAHVEALTQTITNLGGTPVTEGVYNFGEAFGNVDVFLETAQALENTGVAAYAGAAPAITDVAILAAALGIHSVEARHAAYLNQLNGESPFPDAVDTSLTRAQVLDIAGQYIESQATPVPAAPADAAATEPAADAGADPAADPAADPDFDGISNADEAALGTDPNSEDTDGDGIVDIDEGNLYGTDPTVFDTDGDGVSDGDEVFVNGTNPLDPAG